MLPPRWRLVVRLHRDNGTGTQKSLGHAIKRVREQGEAQGPIPAEGRRGLELPTENKNSRVQGKGTHKERKKKVYGGKLNWNPNHWEHGNQANVRR